MSYLKRPINSASSRLAEFKEVMQSKKEIYEANATQCEVRAQEMPPGLRREFLALAANWRKLGDLIDAADGKQDGTEPQGT